MKDLIILIMTPGKMKHLSALRHVPEDHRRQPSHDPSCLFLRTLRHLRLLDVTVELNFIFLFVSKYKY